jgi:EAL domain-containing protein (putative c-di-GMP-specific phosphodiesterase class I)
MRTGQFLAAEGLARWRHPERGLLGPVEFLRDFEGSRLEEQFGDWVVNSALEQLAAWSLSGPPAKISINVTARNLLNAGFRRRLASALAARPSVVRERLQLEVVETTALADLRRAREVFEACRALGVSLAIDDFGTGYSSLSYLSRLPAEVIKIDKSFVLGMLRDPGDLVIVDGIIALANAFGLSVVAEGVETTEQGLALLRLGCEQAQGFGIARPMPAKEIPDWLRNRLPNPAWQEFTQTAPPQVDLPLFAAEQWHREWVAQLAAAARAPEREPLPELAVDACQVGRWISGAGRLRLGGLPGFADLALSHAHMHRLGQQLVERLGGGDPEETPRLMAKLEAGRDDFLAKLRRLQREVSGSRLRP